MMLLNIFGFLNISFADILDILMVAIFIYLAFRWIGTLTHHFDNFSKNI